MFRHYRVILRELVIKTTPNHTSISNAAVGNIMHKTNVKHLHCTQSYQQLHLKYLCNVAWYWLQVPWGWHDRVVTCRSVLMGEIMVHVVVMGQLHATILLNLRRRNTIVLHKIYVANREAKPNFVNWYLNWGACRINISSICWAWRWGRVSSQ
jgi:hypothetical protein